MLLINTPQNPTGMVFDEALLGRIADIVRGHPQMLVLVDEVYKHAIYDPTAAQDSAQNSPMDVPGHMHFASLPGMWDRTITIASAGKTFSVTGWQVGWAVGPEHLIQPIHVSAHAFPCVPCSFAFFCRPAAGTDACCHDLIVQALLPLMQFCASTPLQEAFATILDEAHQPFQNHPRWAMPGRGSLQLCHVSYCHLPSGEKQLLRLVTRRVQAETRHARGWARKRWHAYTLMCVSLRMRLLLTGNLPWTA